MPETDERKKHETHDFVVEDIVGPARDASVLAARLPHELEEVVDAGEDVVHKDDRVEHLALGVAEFPQRGERGVADFGEVLDAVVEGAAGAEGRADDDAEADRAREGVKEAEERLGLVARAVLVDRDKNVLEPEDGRDLEHVGEEVGDDVERVVQVDGEEVLVAFVAGAEGLCPVARVRKDLFDLVLLVVGVAKEAPPRNLGDEGLEVPAEPLALAVLLVPDERLVALIDLSPVGLLSVPEAVAGVVAGQGREDLEHALALVEGRQRDEVAVDALPLRPGLDDACALPWHGGGLSSSVVGAGIGGQLGEGGGGGKED